MKPIRLLDQIVDNLRESGKKKKMAVACVQDSSTIVAVAEAIKEGFIEAVMIGDEQEICTKARAKNINPEIFTIVHITDDIAAIKEAVRMVRDNEADIIMKGLVSTDKYMKAILNKENGLVFPNTILSHVSVIENPNYHKLMIVSDVAVIPQPDLNQKIAITNYVIKIAHALGISKPKVALIAASEQVLPKMEVCVHAAVISKMADRGQIKNAYVDGPLSIDVAIDKESAEIKKVDSHVAGDADCLVFSNIDAANVFYKINTKFIGSELGAIVMGTKAPAILPSRSDSAKTKLYSIALAALTAEN